MRKEQKLKKNYPLDGDLHRFLSPMIKEINNIIMKSKFNSYTPFIWSAVSIFLLSIWLYQTDKSFDMVAYAILGLSVLIIGINLYIKIKGFKEERMGLASEDELSKGIRSCGRQID